MSSWVKVGVQCIRTRYIPPRGRGLTANPIGATFPIIGGLYTVRKIVFDSVDGAPLLLFEEIINAQQRGYEPGFSVKAFRPVVSQSDDSALFTEIARTAKLDATTEQLERAWRESERVIADDQSLRWIEEQARSGK